LGIIPVKSTDVSEEHIASIFRVEEKTKQVTSMKHVASRTAFLLHASCWLLGYPIFKTDSAQQNCATVPNSTV
jgi:hypothetical protein